MEYTLENISIMNGFLSMYRTLSNADVTVIRHLLDPDVNINDIILAHNLIEDAKRNLVQSYLPFRVVNNHRGFPKGD